MKHSTDSNQKPIVRDLRALGFSVQDLSPLGKNTPDLFVAKGEIGMLVEIKMPAGVFYIGQLEFLAMWKGYCGFAKTTSDVRAMFSDPKAHCLSLKQKDRLLAQVTRWQIEGKNRISVKEVEKLFTQKPGK